jgi:hypothetical protein
MGTKYCGAQDIVDMRWMVVELIYDIMVRLIHTRRSYLGIMEEVEEFKEMIIVTISKLVGEFNLGDYILFLIWLDLQGCKWMMKKYNRRRDDFLQRVIDNNRLCIKEENVESLIDVLIHLVEKVEYFCSDDAIVKATATVSPLLIRVIFKVVLLALS